MQYYILLLKPTIHVTSHETAYSMYESIGNGIISYHGMHGNLYYTHTECYKKHFLVLLLFAVHVLRVILFIILCFDTQDLSVKRSIV